MGNERTNEVNAEFLGRGEEELGGWRAGKLQSGSLLSIRHICYRKGTTRLRLVHLNSY